jgi:transcriptional regulator with XRE-family HTH domain
VKSKKVRKYYRDDDFLIQVGINIRSLRTKKDISVESLANECEVDYTQINRMELGKVNFSISYLKKVASALNVDPKQLLP